MLLCQVSTNAVRFGGIFVRKALTASEIQIKLRRKTRVFFSERSPQTFTMYKTLYLLFSEGQVRRLKCKKVQLTFSESQQQLGN